MLHRCAVARPPKRPQQLELSIPTWGGARRGAGRKRASPRPTVPHVSRPRICADWPLHVTLRVRAGLPNLRRRSAWAAIVRVVRQLRGRFAVRFVHYSVLGNHLHFICEAEDRSSLARAIQALCARLAKSLNELFGRSGPVFASRYHARSLTTPQEVRNALRYVLLNGRHHARDAGIELPDRWIDPRSTAATFDGWRDGPTLPERGMDFGTSPAQSWLLRIGWKRGGLLDLADTPGPARRGSRARS